MGIEPTIGVLQLPLISLGECIFVHLGTICAAASHSVHEESDALMSGCCKKRRL